MSGLTAAPERNEMAVNTTTGSSDLASRIEKLPGALKASELAELLNLGKTAVYEMAAKGRIPCIRIGATVRFDPSRTATWIREHEMATDETRGRKRGF
jgi:excisionase family DNA binding protein